MLPQYSSVTSKTERICDSIAPITFALAKGDSVCAHITPPVRSDRRTFA